MNPEPNMEDQDDEFDFVSVEEVESQNKPPERSFWEGTKRRAKRYAVRSAESLAGLPGDIVQTVRSIASSTPDIPLPFGYKIKGGIQPREEMNFVQRAGRDFLESLPGSAELRAKGAEKFPELEPEGEWEDWEDEVVADMAALAIPVKGKVPFARALGLSLLGNSGKKAMEEMGFEGTAAEATKMGLMLFGGMFGRGRGAKTWMNNLYKKMRGSVQEGTKIPYAMRDLEKVENILAKGAMNDAKAPVADFVNQIKAKAPSGMMSIEDALEFDRNISREIRRAAGDKTKKGFFKQLKKANLKTLEAYGEENKQFGDALKEAKQAYAGLETSIQIQDFVKKNANLKNMTYSAALLGMQEAAIPGHTGMKLAALGGTAATMYMGEVAKRIATNPALRRYYQNVIQAALSDNAAMLNRNLQGLEREAKKEFEKNPIEIFNIDEEEEDEEF